MTVWGGGGGGYMLSNVSGMHDLHYGRSPGEFPLL